MMTWNGNNIYYNKKYEANGSLQYFDYVIIIPPPLSLHILGEVKDLKIETVHTSHDLLRSILLLLYFIQLLK